MARVLIYMPLLPWGHRVVVPQSRPSRRQEGWQSCAGIAMRARMPILWYATGKRWQLQCASKGRIKNGRTRLHNEGYLNRLATRVNRVVSRRHNVALKIKKN